MILKEQVLSKYLSKQSSLSCFLFQCLNLLNYKKILILKFIHKQPGEQYCKRNENGGLITCLSCNFVASMNQSTNVNKQTVAGSSTMLDAGSDTK